MIPQSSPLANYLAHKPGIDAAISRVLGSGRYILGNEVTGFESAFAGAMGCPWAVGVANGTDALEIALRALGIALGDRVLTVSHTAVATASAIARIGAVPLFVDIDPDSYTMSPASFEQALSSSAARSAKAVVIVHMYGQPADMPALLELARGRGLAVVEDCAQAHGAKIHGKLVGSWGDAGCFSFYPTKNLGALGDGGAVTGNDSDLEQRIRRLREYGWRERYISESFGFNSRLDELQAAVLGAKLPSLESENGRRREIARRYEAQLRSTPLKLPQMAKDESPVFHQYVVETQDRDGLRRYLLESGIASLIHYPAAVHQQPAFANAASRIGSLACTDRAIPRILSLPMFPELSDSDVNTISAAIRDWVSANSSANPD